MLSIYLFYFFARKKFISWFRKFEFASSYDVKRSSTKLLQSLARGNDQFGHLVLVVEAIAVGIVLPEQLLLLGLRERITAGHREADLVEEELRLILLKEVVAI